MFKIRDISLSDNYTDGDLANALMAVVTYTYGDRMLDFGYDIVDVVAEGESDSGYIDIKPTVLCRVPDATIFVTEHATGKMGVIPMSSAEAQFIHDHQTVIADIAKLLGYPGYIVYSYVEVTSGKRSRFAKATTMYNFSTGQGATIVAGNSDTYARGIYVPDVNYPILFRRFSEVGFTAEDQAIANGVVLLNSSAARIPLEYYLTDMQNVQDAARAAVAGNKRDAEAKFDAVTQVYANIASLVGSLAVFGNTVKDVTERYNSVTQYIPRP